MRKCGRSRGGFNRGTRGLCNDAWDSQHDREHVEVWVRSLQARGLDPAAIRDEVGRWTSDGMTQICVGQYARTIPVAVARDWVDKALAETANAT
jgi:hypothetical protein